MCIVYVYLNPEKPFLLENEWGFEYEPFYVGIGALGRHLYHLEYTKKHINENLKSHKFNTIKHLINKNMLPIIEIIATYDNREDAGELEQKIISTFGRRDQSTGLLTNMTKGGDGIKGLSTDTWKLINKKRSEKFVYLMKNDEKFKNDFLRSHSGENHWTTNKSWPESGRLKIRKTLQKHTPWNQGLTHKDFYKDDPEKYERLKIAQSEKSKANYNKLKRTGQSRFAKKTYALYKDDKLVVEICGSRNFYNYCKDRLINLKELMGENKSWKEWKLEMR